MSQELKSGMQEVEELRALQIRQRAVEELQSSQRARRASMELPHASSSLQYDSPTRSPRKGQGSPADDVAVAAGLAVAAAAAAAPSLPRSSSFQGMSGLTAMALTPAGFKPAEHVDLVESPQAAAAAAAATAVDRARALLNGNSFSSSGSVSGLAWAAGEEGGALLTGRAASFRAAPRVSGSGDVRPWSSKDI